MDSALAGFGLGFFVAAQLGPISLLMIRSTLRHGLLVGVAIGAGVAIVDAAYALLGVLGAARLLEIEALQLTLGLAGAGVLAFFGARTLWAAFRVRLGGEATGEVETPRAAFGTSLAATASNPLTIASWGAIFAAASAASLIDSTSSAAALLAGVGIGSFTWCVILSSLIAVARRRAGQRTLRAVDALSGTGLLVFAAALGYKTVSEQR
jgi:putative LysE/RhtB family amino acid efflux pump